MSCDFTGMCIIGICVCPIDDLLSTIGWMCLSHSDMRRVTAIVYRQTFDHDLLLYKLFVKLYDDLLI